MMLAATTTTTLTRTIMASPPPLAADPAATTTRMSLGTKRTTTYAYLSTGSTTTTQNKPNIPFPQIKYKTLTWPFVAILMIAEIVSNGMLSLPSSLAVVGLVPGLILIVFLGVFATYTSWLLVQFKMNHPEVHNMGDAGLILFGPVGREVLAFGTVVFAVFATGGQLLAGQLAITALSVSGAGMGNWDAGSLSWSGASAASEVCSGRFVLSTTRDVAKRHPLQRPHVFPGID